MYANDGSDDKRKKQRNKKTKRMYTFPKDYGLPPIHSEPEYRKKKKAQIISLFFFFFFLELKYPFVSAWVLLLLVLGLGAPWKVCLLFSPLDLD